MGKSAKFGTKLTFQKDAKLDKFISFPKGANLLKKRCKKRHDPGNWFCPRKNCLPFIDRLLLAKKKEAFLRMAGFKEMLGGEQSNRKKVWKAEDKIALPSCTTEGVNYALECMACRNQERKRTYFGET